MSKLTIFVIAIALCSMISGAAHAYSYVACWNGDGDDAVWDECDNMCAARGAYCKTVYPRKSMCTPSYDCIVDFWKVCSDGYKKVKYGVNTGYDGSCAWNEPGGKN